MLRTKVFRVRALLTAAGVLAAAPASGQEAVPIITPTMPNYVGFGLGVTPDCNRRKRMTTKFRLFGLGTGGPLQDDIFAGRRPPAACQPPLATACIRRETTRWATSHDSWP